MPAASQQVALPPRYRVVRHIANGGMASVWAAEDEMLERLVAVKVLAPGYAADPAARRRFTREARAAARVSDHPHVATVFDIGEHDGQAFIVMEHLAGGSIADRLKRGDPVPAPTALDWLEQAASALDYAHANDIVHRDVKPGNLLLDERGRLAVGDFGIASIAGDTSMTQAGQVLGTAAYLSPEQARGEPATPASDRYSLAVVAYELLCGRRPFTGDTPAAQARAHVEVEPPTPTGPCEAAAGVLTHALSKDPAERPPTAAAFVEDLRRTLGERAEPERADPTTATRRISRPAAAGAAAAGAGAAAAAERRRPAREPARDRTPPPRPPAPAHAGGRSRRWVPLAVLALLCLLGGGAAALIAGGGDGGSHQQASTSAAKHRSSTKAKAKPKPAPAATASTPAASAPAASAPQTTSTPASSPDGRSPSQLNDAGFAMLPGNPGGAVPLLQRAVDGYRKSGDTHSIGYAYALYNLGWALRLSGHPDQAIPYLQERLRVSNDQRGTVEKELKTAQRQAGQKPGKQPGKQPGKKPGKGPKG